MYISIDDIKEMTITLITALLITVVLSLIVCIIFTSCTVHKTSQDIPEINSHSITQDIYVDCLINYYTQ